MTLFLVRHGRPLVDPATPAASWELDPAGFDDVWALRDRVPQAAVWFTAPEPTAVETCQLLTEGEVGIVEGLRGHQRGAAWVADQSEAVRRAFRAPDVPAVEGWEPLSTLRDRVLGAVGSIREVHGDRDLVLVGHGTAWILVAAALSGVEPDPERWARLGTPDLITLPEPLLSA